MSLGGDERWDGDLRHFGIRVWPEEGDLAAMVVTRGGHARLWLNSHYVAGEAGWLVWLWAREQAKIRKVAVLFADELPAGFRPPPAPQRVTA